MVLVALLACAPSDVTPWVGTWFGTVDWWEGDLDHGRTLLLEIAATGEAEVPARAVGTAWAAHDEAVVACDGVAGGEAHHEGLVLVCEADGHPVVLALNGVDSDAPDHVEGQASEIPEDVAAPPVTPRAYDAWDELAGESCPWFTPYCAVSLDHAIDGVTERTLETPQLVRRATPSCSVEVLYPWPTFEGEVAASVSGVLLEYARRGEVIFYAGLDPDGSGRVSWDGYPMGESSDTCDDLTLSLYAATGGLYEGMERIDL